MEYAMWLMNRSPSKALEDKHRTPYEAWHGKKPNLTGVHTFGCMAVGFIPKILRDSKFHPSVELLCFLGMSDNHKGWFLVDMLTHDRVVVRSGKLRDDVMYTTWKRRHHQGQDLMGIHMFDVEEQSNDNASSHEQGDNNNANANYSSDGVNSNANSIDGANYIAHADSLSSQDEVGNDAYDED